VLPVDADLTPSADHRWLAVGQSGDADARQAGQRATAAALGGRPDPKLLIVFCCEAYDLAELVEGIRAAAGDTPMIGCSTAGEISTGGPGDAGVVVTALGGPGFDVATAAADAADGRLRQAGAEVAACLDRLPDANPVPDPETDRGPDAHPAPGADAHPAPGADAGAAIADAPAGKSHRVLLLLTDGLAGDQAEIVRGAYRVVGAEVPLVGGCAGDDLRMAGTAQLHDGKVLRHAVVAAAIASDAPLGIGVRHGWRRVGSPMVVTRSEGNRVHLLDDAPALDVYLQRLQAPPAAHTDPQAFTRFAMTHPLGLSRRSGEEVRFVAGADFTDRSIACIAQVPQGGLTWFMEGDDDSVLDATDAACGDALAALGGRPPLGFLAFDCIARRGVLGEAGISREVDRIASFAAGAPVAGFYTYGEIARTHGISGFHNQTLVVLAVA
jgi:hypothetical protein